MIFSSSSVSPKMHSPCISESCFRGCCPNPLPANPSLTSQSSPWHEFTASIASTLHPNTQFSNHESLPSLDESFSSFIESCPQFSHSTRADQIRAREYFHLCASKQVCLDYIGHGLFSYSQQTSSSSSSVKSTPFFDISYKSTTLNSQILYGSKENELELKIRTRLMGFMNLSEADYTMVFTANQTSALKLLADSYPFESNPNLLTVYDYKSEAIEAMIESSKKRGARSTSAEFLMPNLRIESGKLRKMMNSKRKKENKGLFVFPLQSKMTGARYSYRWMSLARENGWHVLLDACALGAKEMETLGLSIFRPDFLFCSCFKVFGENPSGFGCLFIKKSTASIFKESTMSTSIGIVSLLPVTKPPHFDDHTLLAAQESPKSLIQMLRDEGYGINQIKNEITIEFKGLDHADSLGLVLISCRARYLINWLVNAMISLTHPNSQETHSLVKIYGPKIKLDRGPAIAFNVFDWKGEKIDPALVQKLADRNNISLSVGSLQHITFSNKYEEEAMTSEVKETFLKKKKERLGSEVSVVTVAIGFLTNFEDVYRVWSFVSRFLDADYVEKERWRYTALNQKAVEV